MRGAESAAFTRVMEVAWTRGERGQAGKNEGGDATGEKEGGRGGREEEGGRVRRLS